MVDDKVAEFAIRTMSAEELDLAVGWAAQEGWNPGRCDAECFLRCDPDGFFMGFLDKEPVGCISAIAYGGDFGFVGFYIVRPEFRGKGYGIRLWRRAMEHLRGRNVGLDGVVGQQENYGRSGFRLACRNIRFRGDGAAARKATSYQKPWPTAGAGAGNAAMQPAGCAVRNCVDVDIEDLAAYDRLCFPAPRKNFIADWISRPGTIARALVAAPAADRVSGAGESPPPGRDHASGKKSSVIRGFGAIRPCREGWKVGPLFADDRECALAILTSLLGEIGDPLWFLDVPETNEAALAIARDLGLEKVFETVRMYTSSVPDLRAERIFGVTSFELG